MRYKLFFVAAKAVFKVIRDTSRMAIQAVKPVIRTEREYRELRGQFEKPLDPTRKATQQDLVIANHLIVYASTHVRCLRSNCPEGVGVAVDCMLFYPEGVMEATGAGGYAFSNWWFRNPRYAETIEGSVREDAARYFDDFPVIWTERAQELRERRKDTYLPEHEWSLNAAKKILANPELWSPSLYDNPSHRNTDSIADRETAEFIVKEKMPRSAKRFLAQARQRGLEGLKVDYEGRIFDGLISAMQEFRSVAGHRGKSYYQKHIEDAQRDIQEYQRVCAELGATPMRFDFPERMLALRKKHGTGTRFRDVAWVLVKTLKAMGLKGYHERCFDAKVGPLGGTVAYKFSPDNVSFRVDLH